ncbi:Octaprenyl-diphosphate synthase (plasmid) [Streptomyces sp. YIM 121038]|uniref:polyprenyl synthetase family protein n=1 Tax=Streptomyces sp. YIM 121038 TaxID=2136401 RepID=UPI00111071A0|nr:polyprenyl synthetase family protein [Streptomyces sp. YIM 121038]QCX82739.1 Octaprenyl-diphosphate synthase [Streptomyces sp. YIM 121038]
MNVGSTGDARTDLHAIRREVEAFLRTFLEHKERAGDGQLLGIPLQVLGNFLDGGGKRLRPLLCCLGWLAVATGPLERSVLRAAAGLELFHAYVLIHDDLIDGSDTRHGRPTVHRDFGARSSVPRVDWFGQGSAILLGDLCEAWSAELLGAPEGAAPDTVRGVIDRMRSEVVLGQLLDLNSCGEDFGSVEGALRTIHYKTTKYTVERPLQIGAALAGAGGAVLEACRAFAHPLGEAFQMYDDLEDVDGGKASGADLRDGKHTVVLALALRHAGERNACRLRNLVADGGLDEDGVREARELITDSGAPAIVRAMVGARRRQALDVLDTAPFQPDAKDALRTLTDLAIPGASAWEATNAV